MSIEHFDAKAT